MTTGTVKFFNSTKGFGFIKEDGTDREIFVHITALPEGTYLEENDRVEFTEEAGKKGPQAVDVVKIAGHAQAE